MQSKNKIICFGNEEENTNKYVNNSLISFYFNQGVNIQQFKDLEMLRILRNTNRYISIIL